MAEDTPVEAADTAPTVRTSTRTPPPPPLPVEDTGRRVHLLSLALLALLVGIITGFGAVVFRGLIGLVHNLFFLGRFSFAYDSSLFTPLNPWGPWIVVVPVVGAVCVTWIVSNFAPEAKGHGVPEVMDAIYYHQGIIRPVVAVVKSIASAFAIGTGAAVGREGPIIQIGSALGSTLGQVLPMQAGQRITLVAAGAGAGIAATFNTPIGGVLFASELMLPEISVNTFLPVAVATGSATFIGRLFFGSQPAFSVPNNLAPLPNDVSTALILVLYGVLGLVAGAAAAAFIRGLHLLEDGFDRIPGRYIRHATGMLLVGALMYAFWVAKGHYFVEGVGYSSIQAMLHNQIQGAGFLLILFVSKLLATSVSLGSGSSGGIFSPSLFMGASLGAAYASLVQVVLPGAPVSLPAFAMVGMGAMVGGGTGAAMTAVTMIFEMTRDYEIVLPMILAVALALGMRRVLSNENIYTLKLVRRGHPIPKALHANMFLVRSAADIMERDVLVLDEQTPFARFLELSAAQGGLRHVVVTRNNAVIGGLRVNIDLRRTLGVAANDAPLGDLVRPGAFTIVRGTDVAFDVIKTIWNRNASMAIVVSPGGGTQQVWGVVTKEHVADTVARSVQIYPG
ncbi:MAG TPA: chloride channel protein [Rhodopila sp.]|jgi:CIC family chloride channel protein